MTRSNSNNTEHTTIHIATKAVTSSYTLDAEYITANPTTQKTSGDTAIDKSHNAAHITDNPSSTNTTGTAIDESPNAAHITDNPSSTNTIGSTAIDTANRTLTTLTNS